MQPGPYDIDAGAGEDHHSLSSRLSSCSIDKSHSL